MRTFGVLLLLVASRAALAEPRCSSPEQAQHRLRAIAAANQARVDRALAKKGVKMVTLPRQMRAASEHGEPNDQQVGADVVFLDSQSCAGTAFSDGFQFAIDRSLHVFRLITTINDITTNVLVCGCAPPFDSVAQIQSSCGTGARRMVASFALPPHAIYKGSLAVSYTVETGRLDYVKYCPPPPSTPPPPTNPGGFQPPPAPP